MCYYFIRVLLLLFIFSFFLYCYYYFPQICYFIVLNQFCCHIWSPDCCVLFFNPCIVAIICFLHFIFMLLLFSSTNFLLRTAQLILLLRLLSWLLCVVFLSNVCCRYFTTCCFCLCSAVTYVCCLCGFFWVCLMHQPVLLAHKFSFCWFHECTHVVVQLSLCPSFVCSYCMLWPLLVIDSSVGQYYSQNASLWHTHQDHMGDMCTTTIYCIWFHWLFEK